MSVKNEKSKKVDLPYLFIIISILLAASLGLTVFSVIRQKSPRLNKSEAVENNQEKDKKDSSLYEYFDEKFSEERKTDPSDYYGNDPFKGICGQNPNEENASVTSNTVCFY